MPRFLALYLHRLMRDDGRRRRFVSRHRRLGIGGRRRFDGRRYGAGRYIGRRHGAGGYRARRHGIRIRSGAGPATGVAPLSTRSAPLAPQAPGVLALAAPPPAFWCSAHGWVFCPLHAHDSAADVDAVGQSPTSVFEFGSTSAAVADANVVESHLPSPTPATPPPSPRAAAHRRLLALGLPLASPSADSPTSSRGHRAGTWSPAALGFMNGASNGVAPRTLLPGDPPMRKRVAGAQLAAGELRCNGTGGGASGWTALCFPRGSV